MTSDPSVAKLKGTALGQIREDPHSQGLRWGSLKQSWKVKSTEPREIDRELKEEGT